MIVRFSDNMDCSIEFESENVEEKQLLRDIYLNIMRIKPTERMGLLERLK